MVSRLDVSIFLIINLNFLNSNENLFIYFSCYDMPVDKVQKLINAIDNNKTQFTFSPVISDKLRELVKIPEPEKKLVDELKQTKNEFKQMNDELKQQIKDENKQMNDKLEQIRDENKQTNDKFKQMNDELKQQIKDMQELLNSFIKHSNTKNDIKDNN